MAQNTRIDRAGPDDIPAIMAIERGPGYEHLVGRWEVAEHAAEMAKPSVRYFALRESGALAGFAIVQNLDDPSQKAHLKRIAVAAPGGGQGARLLAGLVEALFSETRINRLDLDVFVGNDRARRAYEKAGFAAEGIMRDHHRTAEGEFRDAWLMSILRRDWEARRA